MIIFLLKYLMFNSQDILWFGTYKILTWMKVHYIQNIIIFFFKHFQIEHYLTMECILKILINIKKMYIKPQCLQKCSWSFNLLPYTDIKHQNFKTKNVQSIVLLLILKEDMSQYWGVSYLQKTTVLSSKQEFAHLLYVRTKVQSRSNFVSTKYHTVLN